MTSATDKQLYQAVANNDRTALKTLLLSDAVKMDLGKMEWASGSNGDGAPLQWAAYHGRDEMVTMLVEAGINVNSFAFGSNFRFTALHFAVQCKKALTVKLLLELGADPTLHGNNGGTVGTASNWAITTGFAEYGNILQEHIASAVADSRSAKALIKKLNNMAEEETAFCKGKKIQEEIKAKKAKIKMLQENVVALEADKDFKTDEELKKMKENLDQMKELVEAFRKADTGPNSDANVCPICFKVPEKVFTCGNDDGECDSWFCSTCKEDLTKCLKCRAEFNAVPSKRNFLAEKMLRRT